MTINFHFLMGGWIFPWFDPTAANSEGIDLDALLPPFSLVIILAQAAVIAHLTEVSWSERLRRLFPKRRRPEKSAPLADAASREASREVA